MPGIWHQAGCCCAAKPCVDCYATQPDLVATISGVCDAFCSGQAGTYPVFNWDLCYVPDDPDQTPCCYWEWRKTAGASLWAIQIVCCPGPPVRYFGSASRSGWPNYRFGGNTVPDCGFWAGSSSIWKVITGSVQCNPDTGHLAGAFVLDGLDLCVGCSLPVSLGG